MQITYENKAEDILALYNRTFDGPDDIIGLSKSSIVEASITSNSERFFSSARYPACCLFGAILGSFIFTFTVMERIGWLILQLIILSGWTWWSYRQYPNKLTKMQIEKEPMSIGKRTLTISPEGLELQTTGSSMFKTWNEVWHAELKQEYIFVATLGPIFMIPLRELGDELFEKAWNEIRSCRDKANHVKADKE